MQNYNEKHVTGPGTYRVGQGGHNSPGAESLWGRRMNAGGAGKFQQCYQVLSSVQHVYFRQTSGSNTGAPNLLLPRAP